jgi:hypothetical protein
MFDESLQSVSVNYPTNIWITSHLMCDCVSGCVEKHHSKPLSSADSELYRICRDNVGIVEDI